MRHYYYGQEEITMNCIDKCYFWNNGTYIGSVTCKKECEHCKGFDDENEWIKCDILDVAKGLKEGK